jgi:hypothetical protein
VIAEERYDFGGTEVSRVDSDAGVVVAADFETASRIRKIAGLPPVSS